MVTEGSRKQIIFLVAIFFGFFELQKKLSFLVARPLRGGGGGGGDKPVQKEKITFFEPLTQNIPQKM